MDDRPKFPRDVHGYLADIILRDFFHREIFIKRPLPPCSNFQLDFLDTLLAPLLSSFPE